MGEHEQERPDDLAGEDPPQLESDIEDDGGLPAGEAQDRRGPEPPDEALLDPNEHGAAPG